MGVSEDEVVCGQVVSTFIFRQFVTWLCISHRCDVHRFMDGPQGYAGPGN